MIIINTTYIPDLIHWDTTEIWEDYFDSDGWQNERFVCYAEFYHHNIDNENKLLQQLNEVLSYDTE